VVLLSVHSDGPVICVGLLDVAGPVRVPVSVRAPGAVLGAVGLSVQFFIHPGRAGALTLLASLSVPIVLLAAVFVSVVGSTCSRVKLGRYERREDQREVGVGKSLSLRLRLNCSARDSCSSVRVGVRLSVSLEAGSVEANEMAGLCRPTREVEPLLLDSSGRVESE
jgi:hypothetical protein